MLNNNTASTATDSTAPMTLQQELVLLIPSCDKFSDVWPYFFTLLFKYWPEVKQHRIYLLSNYEEYPDPNITTITIGTEKSWSDNILIALKLIHSEYILVVLEDFLLTEKVDIDTLIKYFKAMKDKSAGYLRLMANPPPNYSFYHPTLNDPNIGEIKKGSEYRTSLQVAIWRKDVLQAILMTGESPWEFELKGSIRSNNLADPFLSIRSNAKQPILYFPNSIVRGKWVIEAVLFLRAQGFQGPLFRPIETRLSAIWRRNIIRSLISKFLVRPLKRLCMLFLKFVYFLFNLLDTLLFISAR